MAKKAPVLKKFVVKYSALVIVEAKNANEAFAIADEEMIGMVSSDELELDDIFAIEVTNDKIHDATESGCCCGDDCTCDDESDDEEDDEDDEDEDSDEEDDE